MVSYEGGRVRHPADLPEGYHTATPGAGMARSAAYDRPPHVAAVSDPSARAGRRDGAVVTQLVTRTRGQPPLQVLEDGTYLSELKAPRKKDGPPIRVRVIEYSVLTEDEHGKQISELFCLATTLLDPAHAPAADLARRGPPPPRVAGLRR